MFMPSTSIVVSLTLWILLVFSVTTWTLIVVKGRLQWRLARLNRRFNLAFWQAHGLAEAEAATRAMQGPLARLSRAGIAAPPHAQAPLPAGSPGEWFARVHPFCNPVEVDLACTQPARERTAPGVISEFTCRHPILADSQPVEFRPD